MAGVTKIVGLSPDPGRLAVPGDSGLGPVRSPSLDLFLAEVREIPGLLSSGLPLKGESGVMMGLTPAASRRDGKDPI